MEQYPDYKLDPPEPSVAFNIECQCERCECYFIVEECYRSDDGYVDGEGDLITHCEHCYKPPQTLLTSMIEQKGGIDRNKNKRVAEVIFTREHQTTGEVFKVQGCRDRGTWSQWGAPQSVLEDNKPDIEKWWLKRRIL